MTMLWPEGTGVVVWTYARETRISTRLTLWNGARELAGGRLLDGQNLDEEEDFCEERVGESLAEV